MKGKKRTLVALAVVLVVVAIALFYFLVPRGFSFQDLQKGDVFQYKNLKWGAGEAAARLSWFKPMKEDYYQGTSPGNELVNMSSDSCIINGEKADVFFYFRDGQLYLMCFTVELDDSSAWFEKLLEDARAAFGQETDTTATDSGITYYKWFVGDTQLQLISTVSSGKGPSMILIGPVER